MAIAKANAPSKKAARKKLPSKELSLVKQANTKATTACMEEEAFAAKCCALQVADNELKRKKTHSTLVLLKNSTKRRRGSQSNRPSCQCRRRGCKEDVRAAHTLGHCQSIRSIHQTVLR